MGYISHHRPVSPYNKLATKSMVMDMRHKCNYIFCKNKQLGYLNVTNEPNKIGVGPLTDVGHAAFEEVHVPSVFGAIL